jgi:hypothetical protein
VKANQKVDLVELDSVLKEVSESLKESDASGIVIATGSFTYIVSKDDSYLPAKIAVAIGVGSTVLGTIFIKRGPIQDSGWYRMLGRYEHDAMGNKSVQEALNRLLSTPGKEIPPEPSKIVEREMSSAPQLSDRPRSADLPQERRSVLGDITCDTEAMTEELRRRSAQLSNNPEAQEAALDQPCHLFFYSAVDANGETRFFDLMEQDGEFSIGEAALKTARLGECVETAYGDHHVHRVYGKARAKSPFESIQKFVSMFALRSLMVLGEARTQREALPIWEFIFEQLGCLRVTGPPAPSAERGNVAPGNGQADHHGTAPKGRAELTRQQEPTAGMQKYLDFRKKVIAGIHSEWPWLDFGKNWVPHDYQFDSPDFFCFLRKRRYATYHDAELDGYIPRVKDISLLDAEFVARMGVFSANQRMIGGLRRGRTDDGAPLIMDDNSCGYKLVGLREFKPLDSHTLEKLKAEGSLQRLISLGTIFEAQSGVYVELVEVYAHPDIAGHLQKTIVDDYTTIEAAWRSSTKTSSAGRRMLEFIRWDGRQGGRR